MAQAWIKNVYNQTGGQVLLYQNEGAWFDNKHYGVDQQMVVPATSRHECDIAVPWVQYGVKHGGMNYGRLGIVGPNGHGVEYFVGPTAGDLNNDYIRCRDESATVLGEVKIGGRGIWPILTYQLIFGASVRGNGIPCVRFDFMDAPGGPDAAQIIAALEEIGKVVATIIGIAGAIIGLAPGPGPILPAPTHGLPWNPIRGSDLASMIPHP